MESMLDQSGYYFFNIRKKKKLDLSQNKLNSSHQWTVSGSILTENNTSSCNRVMSNTLIKFQGPRHEAEAQRKI